MNFTSPSANASFTITSAAQWPSIPFQTDETGAHAWNWEVAWGAFKQSGSANTPSNQWDAKDAVPNFGGTLTVTAQANGQVASAVVKIKGTNPSAAEVTQFLASQPNSAGFD